MLACCNAERRTGRPSATSGGRRSRGVYPVGLREVSVCASLWCDVESFRGRQHGAPAHRSQAAHPPHRLPVPRRAPPRPGRGDRHRRGQRRARRDGRRRVLSSDLPDPTDARRADLRPADRRLRPDRRGRAGPLPAASERRVVTFDDVPRLVLDATTTAEDRTFWENAGFDPAAILSAIAENASGEQRARRLDDHPAARPRAAAARRTSTAAGADRYIRKAKEIIQSLAPHRDASRARPARSGSSRPTSTRSSTATTRTGSPPRPRSTSASTDLAKLTPGPGGAARRRCPSRPRRSIRTATPRQDDEGRLVVPAGLAAGRPPQLHPRATSTDGAAGRR